MSDKETKRSVLIVATFAAFLTPFMSSAINLALPSIGSELGISAVNLNWIASSFILSSAIFLLPFGRLADIAGRKKVFTAGILLFTTASLMVIFTRSYATLIIIRVLQGIGSALIFGTSMAIITSVFPPGERGRALGINITAVYIGLAGGPFLGGVLTRLLGWRSIFLVVVPIGIISILLITTRMKGEWAESRGDRFDWKGSILYGLALLLMMYGFSELPDTGGVVLIVTGALLFAGFLYFEKHTDNPVLSIGIITRNRIFGWSSLAALIHYAATSSIGFFMSLYLQYVKGIDPAGAGMVMISMPVTMAFLSAVAGRLSDRVNPGIVASAGMSVTATGILLLCFITASTPLPRIIGLLVIMGAGFAFFSSPNSNAIMSSVEKKNLGLASAVVGTMRMTGQMMAMGISMLLFAIFLGDSAINPVNYNSFLASMKTGLVISAMLCVLGVFASLARTPSVKNNKNS